MSQSQVLQDLVRVVLRSFYEERHIILVDFLLSERVLSDEELADRLRLVLKEVNRIAAKLREDRLIKMESRQEVRPSDQKTINKTFYYIDYREFIDVVKYKMYRMKKSFEDSMKHEAEKKGYVCQVCKKHFNVFDIQGLANPTTMAFECDLCNGEIEEKNDSEQLQATQELHSLMMDQMGPLLRLLKKTEGVAVPAFNPLAFLKQREAMGSLLAASAQQTDSGTEQGSIATNQSKQPEINVVIHDLDIDAKAAGHELPVWHTHSTITGEQIRETASRTSGSDYGSVVQSIDAGLQEEESVKRYYESLHESAISPERKRVALELDISPPLQPNGEETAEESSMVYVAGQPKPFAEITDEDKAIMSPEEYAQYYEVYMANM